MLVTSKEDTADKRQVIAQSPSIQSVQPEPPREPYVHQMPDFMQNQPPKIVAMPQTISIKDALQNRVVIAGIGGTGNKDDTEKPNKGMKL